MSRDNTLFEPRLLVVNADDFGLSLSISEGIIEAHNKGIVTTTSVVPNGPAFAESIELLRHQPRLGIGVHLTLVGEDPLLSDPKSIPSLVNSKGLPYKGWKQFLAAAALGRIDPDDIRIELSAQMLRMQESLQSIGRQVDHLDSHQHLHLWPLVGDAVLSLAREHHVSALRLPRISIGARRRHKLLAPGFNLLARRLASAAHAQGVATTGAFAGLAEAGRLADIGIENIVSRLASTNAATAELGCHPGQGAPSDHANYKWGYDWRRETNALCDPALPEVIASNGFVLGTYADLRVSRHASATASVSRAVQKFGSESKSTRGHVRVRAETCPLDSVLTRIPRGGKVLDLGCGHGLVSMAMAIDDPSRTVVGVDLDANKIEEAQRVSGNLPITFVQGDGSVPRGPWDAITIVDVLYLLGPDRSRDLIARCSNELAVGGRLIIHNSDSSPRWKWWIALVQEYISVRLTRITKGAKIQFLSQSDIDLWMREAGLHVESVPVDWGFVHPHRISVGTK
jgi:predicted glycoside hydrolase/deacetylase ChbG (UPF0249 family)/2-polyprenyl-3-methyl-5-hydroxy-6-metoxy-1,4-benzoquinol methylase